MTTTTATRHAPRTTPPRGMIDTVGGHRDDAHRRGTGFLIRYAATLLAGGFLLAAVAGGGPTVAAPVPTPDVTAASPVDPAEAVVMLDRDPGVPAVVYDALADAWPCGTDGTATCLPSPAYAPDVWAPPARWNGHDGCSTYQPQPGAVLAVTVRSCPDGTTAVEWSRRTP